MLRSVPNSLEAEQAVLSAMFLSRTAQDIAFESIDENAFYYDNNKNAKTTLQSGFKLAIIFTIIFNYYSNSTKSLIFL